jgi:hypothetical protein
MPGRNRTRAARRNAERTSRNALARETAAELAESRPKLRRARTKTQLETLEARGAMSHEQHRAGARLARDYYASNTVIGRLVGRYEANLPKQPKKYQAAPDTPSAIVARERYDQAMKTVGPWLSGILVHVCITDEPASGWGPMNGKAATDGIALLRLGLDVWCGTTAATGGPRERLVDPRGTPGRREHSSRRADRAARAARPAVQATPAGSQS